MGEGWWKEKDREKESNKLILNRGKEGRNRGKKKRGRGNLRGADVSRFHDNIPLCLVINAAGRWKGGGLAPGSARDPEKLGGTGLGKNNGVARWWLLSRRGEARRGVAATTTTSSSVHFVGRFKLASDTSWEEARQRSPRACYGSFERNASLPWMSATRRDIIQREEEETNEQLAWNSNRALGGWGYLEANFSYELLENSISTRIPQGGQKRGEYNLDWKSKLRALIGGDSERVNLVNSDC